MTPLELFQTHVIQPTQSIRQAIELINANKDGIALVVDSDKKLLGTITDGDVRRYMISHPSLDAPCSEVMEAAPVTASSGQSDAELKDLMLRSEIRNLPLVKEDGQLVGLVKLKDLLDEPNDDRIFAVVMAGGEGKRLRPITEKIPKPMLEVGGEPILERIVKSLAAHQIQEVYLSVNFMSEMIKDHFQDGSQFGVKIHYIDEEKKMGTAGPLSLLKETPRHPIIVINGDVVTNVNFRSMIDFHRRHRSALTIGASEYTLKVPYGVLNLAGPFVVGTDEKPSHQFLCNAGIYVVDPEVFREIPADTPTDMTDVIDRVSRKGLPVTAFPLHEYWVDIGEHQALENARKTVQPSS